MNARAHPADPHAGQPVVAEGAPLDGAAGVLVMVHGRGASAESILSLFRVLDAPRFAALAPQAAGNTWYPYPFTSPMEMNQPYLDSALRRLETLVDEVLARGFASSRIALLGFSQGACLTLEFAARHPRRYGAVMGLSGGLIGPPGTPRDYAGSFDGAPVFLGCGDPDSHIPFERVRETEAVLARMGADVELRRYPGIPHTVIDDEVDACRVLLRRMIADAGEAQP